MYSRIWLGGWDDCQRLEHGRVAILAQALDGFSHKRLSHACPNLATVAASRNTEAAGKHILNLTILWSLHCDQAGKALLICMHLAQVGTDAVELLIWKHADPNAIDVDGSTPLCAAPELGHLEVVHFLRDVGAERNQTMTVGRTSLCIASHQGHLEVDRFLCDSGAAKNLAMTDGRTPLYVASRRGHLEVLRVLCYVGAEKIER